MVQSKKSTLGYLYPNLDTQVPSYTNRGGSLCIRISSDKKFLDSESPMKGSR